MTVLLGVAEHDTSPIFCRPPGDVQVIAESSPHRGQELLTFTVADLRCAVAVEHVREVVPAARLEPIPGAPPAAMGVLDLRSELVVVLDGHRCLGMESAPLGTSDRYVVLDTPRSARALRVDAVHDVIGVEERDVAALPVGAGGAATIAGLIRLDDGLLMIHDPVRFLSVDDATVLQRAIADLMASR